MSDKVIKVETQDKVVANAQTCAALKEVNAMKEDPSFGKTYADVREMLGDILNEND